MYVCVYAICKNEEKFAKRWAESMSEADDIFVLDTGSTDKSVDILRKHNVHVSVKEIKPWRFDVARNESLSLVPKNADICVCTDIDEIFKKGWRKKLEKAWLKNTTRLSYRYTWNFNSDGSEGTVFYSDKIHSRNDYTWINPVHEVLKYIGDKSEIINFAKGVQLNHHADDFKSRSQYLPLLELAVKENPKNDRNVHYLGREYMFYGKWEKSIETLKYYLTLPTALWAEERCASMRYIARCYENLNDSKNAKIWYFKAVAECPHTREPWIDSGKYSYMKKDWHGVIYFINEALKIQTRSLNYITDADSWGYLPYDLLSLGYYYVGDYKKSLDACNKAIEISPFNKRLQSNKKLIEEKIRL